MSSPPYGEGELPVATASLLGQVSKALDRYVAWPTPQYREAVAAWVLHTHVTDAFDSTPRLAALSPEKGSGKTRLLEVLAHLVHEPIHAANSSVAAMFRIIGKKTDEAMPPTLLLDECDTLFGPKAPAHNEELRGLVNAGHRRGVGTLRCVGEGASMQVVTFEAYAPVALAGIGDLPDTIMQRAVVVPMRRRAPGETVDPFRIRNGRDELEPLRDAIAEWGRVAVAALDGFEPTLPHGVEDRPADVWEPLLAIGELADEPWTTTIRNACRTIVTADERRDAEDGSLGLKLLNDIRYVFGERDHLTTAELLKSLTSLDESPWSDLAGKPLDPRKLARLLKPYNVSSTSILVDRKGLKGYRREDLHDPWTRYLPPRKSDGRRRDKRDVRDVRDPAGSIAQIADIAAPETEHRAACVDCDQPATASDVDGHERCADHVSWNAA